MTPTILGIHHVTAICGDPQTNVDFYCRLLGLHLVKVTVNYDDPSTYHLYYGDEQGTPGTILTFFAWPGAQRGLHGTGQITETAFSIPSGSIGFWADRLGENNVRFEGPTTRFKQQVLSFVDGDGLRLELVESHDVNAGCASDSAIPSQFALRGFHSATVSQIGYEKTASILRNTMGFSFQDREDNRFRFSIGSAAPSQIIDVLCVPAAATGHVAVGTVHHIAWRTPDDASERAWLDVIASAGYHISPIIDRTYFHSIYYREPGGALFEIATDGPGFTVDEAPRELGTRLVLPAALEDRRRQIEEILPKIELLGPTERGIRRE